MIESDSRVTFTEVIAEQFDACHPIPQAIRNLVQAQMPVIPHGIGLSIGDAYGPSTERLDALSHIAERLNAPLISEHATFVRAGGLESGHLLPLPRTYDMLDILSENVENAMRALPVPLALENIATLVEWPGAELDEGEFLAELHRRTGVRLLLDLANLYANHMNHGWDARAFLNAIPVDAVAYVHLAGGRWAHGMYIDTHADPLPREPLVLLNLLFQRGYRGGVLLERDENFISKASLQAELAKIEAAVTEHTATAQPASVEPSYVSEAAHVG
jgi:hypothetical protein